MRALPLVGVVVVAGAIGLAVSLLQHPVSSPTTPLSVTPPSLRAPSLSPTPIPRGPVSAFGFSVADDLATRRVVLFGGVDSYDDTWLWDGSRWSHVVPSISPPGRFHAAAAYDPSTKLVMLFGGRKESGALLNDT